MSDERKRVGPCRSEAERRVGQVAHRIIKTGEGKEMPGEEIRLGVWDTVDGTVRELGLRARKIDLGEVVGSSQLIMLGEEHTDSRQVEFVRERVENCMVWG